MYIPDPALAEKVTGKKIRRNHLSVCSFIREELCGGCRPKLFAKTLKSL